MADSGSTLPILPNCCRISSIILAPSLSPSRDAQRRVIAFNPAAGVHLAALSGRNVDIGDDISSFFNEDDRGRVRIRSRLSRASSGESTAEERQFRGLSGARIWLELSFSPVACDESADEVLFGLLDISARIRGLDLDALR